MSEKDPPEGNSGWTPEPTQQQVPRTRTSRIFEIVLWVALVGIVASVAIPELAGHPLDASALPGALLGFLLLPFLIAKARRASRPWLYPLAGIVLFFGLAMLGGAMRGVEKRGHGTELFAAIDQFEPETGKQARAAEKNPALLKSILQPAVRRAAQRVPDADLLAYNDALFALIETPSGIDRQRCATVFTGGKQKPPTSEEEINIAKATARLFRAAAAHPEPVSFDMQRSVALRGEMVRAADEDGVFAAPERLAALTQDQHCALYLRMMKNLRKLPVADAALIMRGNLTATE